MKKCPLTHTHTHKSADVGAVAIGHGIYLGTPTHTIEPAQSRWIEDQIWHLVSARDASQIDQHLRHY